MTMRTVPAIGVDIHFGPDNIRHKYHPGDDKCHAYGVLKIDNGGATYANLYFDADPAHIDKMIAELVALKQEMDAPVISDSERTCPHTNNGEPCHRGGDHGVHRDADGEEWRTDGEPDACGARPYPAGSEGDDGTECILPAGHDGGHDDAPERFISGSPFCPERDFTGTLCELPLKHDGDHRAPGNDEGDPDVTWARDAECYDITGRTA